MATYDLLRDLPVEIDSYTLEGLVLDVSSNFTRHTTVIRLAGGGQEALGEDVTYEGDDQLGLQAAGPVLPLAGSYTLDSFSELIGGLDTFPTGPDRDVYRNYRRWAFESAALDLALRQAGIPLTQALDRDAKPLNFVVSMRLGDAPTSAPVRGILEHYPAMKFKLDATSDWSDELITELRDLGVVDSIDLKGHYEGTSVDQGADVDLYRRIVEGFPNAWIEDPALTPETEAVLEGARDRVTWDAIIHSVADIEALKWPPKTVNVKPSRFGSLSALCEAYDYCEARGIGAYGGGQFELGPGRGQIQYLAAVFHPDTPNDVAPGGFNLSNPGPGLPSSPLDPAPEPIGFRRRTNG
jgi:L-alanine-DL-glutamate epimerase-like enolase superfamily enzyme